MYRLTWRSVMCLPDNQGSPAIAGGTLIETAQAAHLTGHPNCRQAAIVVVAADGAGSAALRIATAEVGEMAAEIGSSKAGWNQAEEDHGMP
jgi:hypothetical protein